jgi:hypothetical protein
MFVPETQRHEQEAIDEVCERLRHRFGSIERQEVGSVVHGVAEEFSGARVRDFVPVLVEHIAKDRLASRQAVPHARSAGPGRPGGPGTGMHRRP